MLTGYSGIHGIDADWDTPRVLTFLNEDNLWGGALSPDGNWYASPRGNFTITETWNGITDIWEVRVFPVNGQRDLHYSIPFEAEFYQYTHGQVYWRDNDYFLYFDLMNPFTGEIYPTSQSEMVYDLQPYTRSYFSPDWKREIFYGYTETSTGSKPEWKMYDVPKGESLSVLSLSSPIAWKPDSLGFVAAITNGADIPAYSLALFDQDGIRGEVIITPPDQEFGLFALDWSADGRYLAFITFPFDYYIVEGKAYSYTYYDSDNTLYIADTQQKRIINTCISVGEGLSWSPAVGVSQLAIMPPGAGTKDVLILDVESETLYSVAQHLVTYNRRIYQGMRGSYHSIIGWRTD